MRVLAGPCALLVLITCLLVLEEGAYEKLSKCIIARFPTSTTPNMMDGLGIRLLRRFSSLLLSPEYPSTEGASPKLRASCRKVELSCDVLKALEENKIPTSHRRSNVVINSRRIDSLPFHSLGITVPSIDVEVRGVYTGVLSQLKNTLEVCGFMAEACAWN